MRSPHGSSPLLLRDPLGQVVAQPLARRDRLDDDRHERVVGAAELRALPVEHAGALDREPDLVDVPVGRDWGG